MPGGRVWSAVTTIGVVLPSTGGAGRLSGVGRLASGSGTGGPPSSAAGVNAPRPRSWNPPITRIWSAVTLLELVSTRARGLSEFTTIPPLGMLTPPVPSTSSARGADGSSRQSTQLLGAAGPAPAAAVALMLLEARPRIGANAYCTLIGGVITCSAFDPSGQLSPGPGGGSGGSLGMIQQTTSPLLTTPSSAHPAAAGRVTWLLLRKVSTVSKAAAGPSSSSVDAPARAAESAAVCAEVRAAQFSPTSTTSAANASSSVRDSATVMATLPCSEPPRSRNIVGHRPRSGILSSSSRRSSHNPLTG